MADLPHVVDITTDTFETEVLQKSMQTPVLVDFWATWCGPCKSLTPILEKLAGEYGGAFVLAKVDVDREQQIAAAFQIRSVPTVFLLVGGQPVDAFQGALPEGQLRQFLQQHGIEPQAGADAVPAEDASLDQHEEVVRLRHAVQAEPEKDELKLDLALALLKTCDKVRFDLRKSRVDVLVSPSEIVARRKALEAAGGYPYPESQTPWQEMQRAVIGQMDTGAVLEPAVKYQRIAQTKGLPRDNH